MGSAAKQGTSDGGAGKQEGGLSIQETPHLTSFDVRFKKFAFHINYFFLGGGGKQMAVTFDRTPIRDSTALHSALGAPVSRFKVTGG